MKNPFSSVMQWLQQYGGPAKIYVFVSALVLSFSAGISADDTDLFFSTESAPANILFVIDDSASMDAVVEESGRTRMEEVKAALVPLIESLEGVNAGIIQFNGGVDFTMPASSVDADVHRQSLLNAVDAMQPRHDFYGTATQAALWAGRSYLRGELAGDEGVYASPIVHECQQNHIILMTDGRPTVNQNIVPEVESELGITCESARVTRDGDGDCGAEIGQSLFDSDLSSTTPGVNNAITHTIGFQFSAPWLATVSGNFENADGSTTGGFGNHFNVDSTATLLNAFNSIIDGIGATFSAPTVSLNSFNESRHRDELYYSQFQSSSSVRWNGNIKKYKLDEITDAVTGEVESLILDADEIPLIDATGQIDSSSRSFWSETDDGGAIPQGGFAHQLPHYTERNWYTDYNSTAPVKVTIDDIDLNAKLPVASLGAADEAERDILFSWALGFDVETHDAQLAAAATEASTFASAEVTLAIAAAEDAAASADTAGQFAADVVLLAEAAGEAAGIAVTAADEAIAAGAANAVDLADAADFLVFE